MTYFDTCYLVIDEYGIQRMTKRRGVVKAGEFTVKIAITLPEGTFNEPEPTAVIHVPKSALEGPDVTVEVAA